MTVLWTIVPTEGLIDVDSGAPDRVYRQADYNGVALLVEQLDERRCQVVRILSSEPNDYLNQAIQPGQVIAAGALTCCDQQ